MNKRPKTHFGVQLRKIRRAAMMSCSEVAIIFNCALITAQRAEKIPSWFPYDALARLAERAGFDRVDEVLVELLTAIAIDHGAMHTHGLDEVEIELLTRLAEALRRADFPAARAIFEQGMRDLTNLEAAS